MTDRQAAIEYELRRRRETLANMYLGALSVTQSTGNRDYLSQAAHSIRELMEKLPEIIYVSVPERKGNLTMNDLKIIWKATLKKTSCRNSAGWKGEIDSGLQKFLQRIETFFAEDTRISRSEEVRRFLRESDGDGRLLPAHLEEQNIKTWKDLRDYFVDIAHHKPTTHTEFMDSLEAFERFIIEKLHPETTADFEQIDKLIEEGESK